MGNKVGKNKVNLINEACEPEPKPRLTKSMPSIFSKANGMEVSLDKSCIHLMRYKKGIHAFLVIESAEMSSEDNGKIIRVLTHAGFRPADGVSNKHKIVCDSYIDVVQHSFPEGVAMEDKDNEMLQYFGGTEKHPSWCVDRCVSDTLQSLINDSKDNLEKVCYSLHGDSSTPIVKKFKRKAEENHNCASWAIDMLSKLRGKCPAAGISKKVDWATAFPVEIPHVILWTLKN